MKKNLPFFLIGFGVFIILFSLLADLIGLGKAGIQAAQIFGIEVGIFFVMAGFVFKTLQQRNVFSVPDLRDLPALVWVMLGALPAYILFFIVPSFFDPSLRIQYPYEYIRQIVPIGIDFQAMLNSMSVWLKGGVNEQVVFAPLVTVLFSPFLLVAYPTSYYLMTLVTLAGYLVVGMLAALMLDIKNRALAAFIAAISIFSYGLIFELERGQSYTLSFMFCLLAVYLFHWQKDLRWLAYILFCISVQMKFYPALFVLLFVDDWRDWKNTLLRFTGLGLANILLLFLFGSSYFSIFFHHLTGGIQAGEVSVTNHSIQSFVSILSSTEWNLFQGGSAQWLERNSGLIGNLLYLYFFICFMTILIGAWVRKQPGFDPDLLMACLIGSLVLPSVNHDYTLTLLTAPFTLVVAGWFAGSNSKTRTIVPTLITSFAYAVILVPPIYRPLLLENSLPLIFIILTVTTLQNIAVSRQSLRK